MKSALVPEGFYGVIRRKNGKYIGSIDNAGGLFEPLYVYELEANNYEFCDLSAYRGHIVGLHTIHFNEQADGVLIEVPVNSGFIIELVQRTETQD